MLILASSTPITGEDVISKLVPNWVSFVTQLLAFLILVAIVIRFAYKPVKEMLKKRQQYIEDNIKASELAKTKSEQNIIKSEELLNTSKRQANEIVEQAKADAETEKEKMFNMAKDDINQMRINAEKDIEQAKIEAKEEIRKEMVDIALEVSGEVLGRNINTEDNARFAEDFIRRIDN